MAKETLGSFLSHDSDIAQQYSPNNDDSCLQLTIGSKKKILWICDKGHEYLQSIQSKITRGARCNVCYGSMVYPGINDLATTHPDLAQQWSPRNDKQACEVKYSSSYKALWICDKDASHDDFILPVADRTRTDAQRRYCPQCTKDNKKNTHRKRDSSA